MKARRWPIMWLVIIVILGAANLLQLLVANAQGSTQTIINFIQADDAPDKFGVSLRVFFTLTDATQQPVASVSVSSAKFILPDDNQTVDADVSKANGPMDIVLVLDYSGSMSNQVRNIQQAASSLVNAAPPDSQFAIIRFSDKVQTSLNFSADRKQVTDAIAALKAGGTTCLYDAAFQGVQLIASAPKTTSNLSSTDKTPPLRRRAVVIFSGNKDATYNKPCSKHTVNDVVNLATNVDNRTPIYTVGYRGFQPIPEADLQTMSKNTGGTSSFGNSPQSQFNDIITAFNAQWFAQAIVQPQQGDRNFNLRLTLASGSNPTDAAARFTSPKDYSHTPTPKPSPTSSPQPPKVDVVSLQTDPNTKEFVIQVSIVSEDQISEYHFDLISPTGTLQSQTVKPAPLPQGPIRIPMGKLDDGDYTIRVSAIGKNGQLVARSDDQRIKIASTPTPEPSATNTQPPVGIQIISIQYVDPTTKDNLLVKLNVQSPDQIAKLRGLLASADTNVTVREYDNLKVDSQVTLPVSGVPANKYNITIFAVGSNGQQINSDTKPFTYDYVPPTPTPVPTATPDDFVAKLGGLYKDPSTAPVAIIVTLAVVAGLIGVLAVVFLRKPQKAATGTGFLREMTGAVDVSELQRRAGGSAAAGGSRAAPAAAKPPAAKPAPQYDKTEAVPYLNLPDSSVSVEKSRDTASVGKVIPIAHVPFTMGRRERDLNFENDPGVSRDHAEITYDNNVFYITDKGSTNHTFIDEVEVPAGVPKPLYSGATIRLGTSTVLKFRASERGGFDMDKTSPEPFKLS